MIAEIGFAIACLWVIWKPQALVNSMNEWNRTFGGVGARRAPSWVVRLLGLALLALLLFAVWGSRQH
jgi:hypothetical protein